eukprot:750249-Hanusia_phi.AAC.1
MAPARQSDPEALRNYRNHETRNRRGAQSFVTSHNLIIDDGGEEEEEEEPGRRSGQEVARYPRYAGPRRTHLDKMFSTVDRSQYTEQQLKFMLDQAQARATDNARMIPFQGWLGPEPSTSTIGQQRSTSECLKGFATKPEEQSKSVLDDCTFDATFWDRVLTSPNPTRELREIARASLQQRRDGEPAHPHLWWLEQMIRIKYCDPFDEKKDEDKVVLLFSSHRSVSAYLTLLTRCASLFDFLSLPILSFLLSDWCTRWLNKRPVVPEYGGQPSSMTLASQTRSDAGRARLSAHVCRRFLFAWRKRSCSSAITRWWARSWSTGSSRDTGIHLTSARRYGNDAVRMRGGGGLK